MKCFWLQEEHLDITHQEENIIALVSSPIPIHKVRTAVMSSRFRIQLKFQIWVTLDKQLYDGFNV